MPLVHGLGAHRGLFAHNKGRGGNKGFARPLRSLKAFFVFRVRSYAVVSLGNDETVKVLWCPKWHLGGLLMTSGGYRELALYLGYR